MSCVIGLDIGTTSTIGLLLRLPNEPLALAQRPVTLSHPHAGWAEENPLRLGHRDPRSDDAVGGRWMRYERPKVVCTVPSLVQHPDDVPSTIGRKASNGMNKGRVAAFWIGGTLVFVAFAVPYSIRVLSRRLWRTAGRGR
jgi:hypothetical protein